MRALNAQAEEEEKKMRESSGSGAATCRTATSQSTGSGGARGVEPPAAGEETRARPGFSLARASSSDPEAHVMRNGGRWQPFPATTMQLLTDTQHGIVVNVEATTDAIDYDGR